MMEGQRSPSQPGWNPQPPPGMTQTTTTTTHGSPVIGLDWIKFDINYFRTLPGIIKIVQFFFGIFCMALASPAHFGGSHFFLFVAVMAFILTTLWIFIYLLSIREGLTLRIPWIVLEFYYTGGTVLFYTIAMIVQFSVSAGYVQANWTASAVFGLFNSIAYGCGAFFLWREWKQSTSSNNAPNVP